MTLAHRFAGRSPTGGGEHGYTETAKQIALGWIEDNGQRLSDFVPKRFPFGAPFPFGAIELWWPSAWTSGTPTTSSWPLWRTVKYEDVYVKAYADGRQERAIKDTWCTTPPCCQPHLRTKAQCRKPRNAHREAFVTSSDLLHGQKLREPTPQE